MKPIKLVIKLTYGEKVLCDGTFAAYETLPDPVAAVIGDIRRLADVLEIGLTFDDAVPLEHVNYKRGE